MSSIPPKEIINIHTPNLMLKSPEKKLLTGVSTPDGIRNLRDLGDFHLELFADNTILSIEAKNCKTSKSYVKILHSQEIRELTAQLISGTIDLYDVLNLALSESYSYFSIGITDNGVLLIRTRDKPEGSNGWLQFEIKLEEQSCPQRKICKKYFEKLKDNHSSILFKQELQKINSINQSKLIERLIEEVREIQAMENSMKIFNRYGHCGSKQ